MRLRRIAILFALAVVLAGYGGRFHPAGDSLAVIRLPAAVLVILLVPLARWNWFASGLLVAACLISLGGIFAPRLTPAQEISPNLTLYQQNLLYIRDEDQAWLTEIGRVRPNLLTLQEVSPRNRSMLMGMQDDFPTQHFCPVPRVGGVMVAVRYPAVPASQICGGQDGMAAIQVQTPDGPVWVVSLHLRWPWPFDQAERLERLLPLLARLEGPVIVGGDFNSVAWSHALARVAKASQTRVAGPGGATFHVYGVPIGIDHVLLSEEFEAQFAIQPKLGSDHNGVLAQIGRP